MLSWIEASSGGNPLYLKSLALHYRQTGERFVIPSGLRQLINRRLDTLSWNARGTLIACVILGKRCSSERLATVLEVPHLQLIVALEELQAANMVRATEQGIECAHPLIAEATQSPGNAASIKLTHARVAQILERTPNLRASAPLLWDCAEHWLSAGDH